MLPVLLLLLLSSGKCQKLKHEQITRDEQLSQCVLDILETYYTNVNELTFVSINTEDDELLEAIHSKASLPLVYRKPSYKSRIQHEGYVVSANNAREFKKQFIYLIREWSWNPYARFLIIVKWLTRENLSGVFDTLLKLHVFNVIVINATNLEVFTYNPFENFGCGKYYDGFISYGHCNNNTKNLYPNKFVTGLRNCTFTAIIPDWPPFTIIPNKTNDVKLGAEQILFELIGEIEGFNVNYTYNEDNEDFFTIDENMVATGAFNTLQSNEADATMGYLILLASRVKAFSYIYGHLTYVDEFRFYVKRATAVPAWKNLYLEFQLTVWLLLFVVMFLIWILMLYLLHQKDKTHLMLGLIDNLLLHGFKIRARSLVKCLLIFWVWFAYLVNTFYQSSLVSITTNPIREHQISSEEDIIKHKLKPCFNTAMRQYYKDIMHVEVDSYQDNEECNDFTQSFLTVAKANDLYTLEVYSMYRYNMHSYSDDFGVSMLYDIKKPFAKVIYAIYLYKGFPMHAKLALNALRISEHGLANKAMNDLYYLRSIKHHYHSDKFRSHFVIPWFGYFVASSVSIFVFVIEIISKL